MPDDLDRAAVVRSLGGRVDLARKIARLFLGEYARQLVAIREALARGDAPGLARAAHALKGAVGNFPAPGAVEGAQRLERIGRGGDLAGANEACAALEAEIARLTPILSALAAEAR